MDRQTLKLLQLNMQRSSTVANEVAVLLADGGTDVVLAQEPYVTRGRVRGLGARTTIIADEGEGKNAQAAIVCRTACVTVLRIAQLCDSHMVTTQIKCRYGEVYLVTIYFQYAWRVDSGINRIERVLDKLRGRPIIIAADTNAVSPLWDTICAIRHTHDRRRARGRRLEDLISFAGLVVLNKLSELPTYRGNAPGQESCIDVTLATPEAVSLVRSWRVIDDATSSDHRAIEITLGWNEGDPVVAERPGRYDLRRANWQLFAQTLRESVGENPLLGNNESTAAEGLAVEIQRCILNTCERSIPRRKWHARAVPGWTPEVVSLKRETYRARRELQRSRGTGNEVEILSSYRRKRKSYRKALAESRAASWKNFVTETCAASPWGIPYKCALNRLRREEPMSSLASRGAETLEWEQSARTLLDVLTPDDNPDGDTEDQRRVRADTTQLLRDDLAGELVPKA